MVIPALEGEVARPDETVRDPASVGSSRALAVRRVFRGGLASLSGALLTGVASYFGVASGVPFALGMASFVLGGFGLVEIGRAARHFLRYGSRSSQLAFLSTAGLGASAVLAGFSNWIGVTFGGAIWEVLVHWSMNGVYTFGVIVLLSALRVLILWAVEPKTKPSLE